MTRRPAILGISLVVILLAPAVASAGGPTPVLDGRKSEVQPAASEGYLVWNQGFVRSFVKPDGAPRVQMNPDGTRSFAASIDGTTAVFHRVVSRRNDGDLFMFDVLTESISDPPAGVNTRAFEHEPSISGDWLLFTRWSGRRDKVILFNLSTTEVRILASVRSRGHYLISDQVNGDWATWESCDLRRGRSFTNCEAFRYQISVGGSSSMLPNPGRQQYAAGVTSDGTAYVVRTGRRVQWRCGAGARIVRIATDDTATVIASLPRGIDAINTFAFQEGDGSTTLYHEWWDCRARRGDIYKISGADTA